MLDAQRQAIAALASTAVEHLNSLPAEFGLAGLTGASELVERFTRVDADTLEYTFTVSDPETWLRPWTVSMRRSFSPIKA